MICEISTYTECIFCSETSIPLPIESYLFDIWLVCDKGLQHSLGVRASSRRRKTTFQSDSSLENWILCRNVVSVFPPLRLIDVDYIVNSQKNTDDILGEWFDIFQNNIFQNLPAQKAHTHTTLLTHTHKHTHKHRCYTHR
jgi:hypothetical protein